MEIEEAIKIVRALADGIDPTQNSSHALANPERPTLDQARGGIERRDAKLSPSTGQPLGCTTGDDVQRNPQVVIALHRAIGALEAQAERESNKKLQPANAYRWWSKAEDQQVCTELRQGLDFKEIARKHNRTVPSIVARLIKLGKVTPKSSQPLFADEAAS